MHYVRPLVLVPTGVVLISVGMLAFFPWDFSHIRSTVLPWIESRLALGTFGTVLVFILAYAVGSVILFPSAVLTLTGGYLFDQYAGTCINLLGATLGSTLCFLIARTCADTRLVDAVRRRTVMKLPATKLPGFLTVLLLRLTPAVPYSALNYGFGLTRVSPVAFAAGTCLGLFPKVLVGTLLGAAGRAYGNAQLESWSDHRIVIPIALFGFLLLTGLILEKRFNIIKSEAR